MLLLGKELLLSSLVAPVLPRGELHVGAFVPRVLAGQLEGQEYSLLKCGLGDHLCKHVLLLLELLALHEAEPLDKGLSQESVMELECYLSHEIIFG